MPSRRSPRHLQTTYTERFVQALGLLCTKEPPAEMCEAWLFSDDERLQEWAIEHARMTWAQGIGTIDAAREMAEHCEEGDDSGGAPLHLTFADDLRAYRQKHGIVVDEPASAAGDGQESASALLGESLSSLESLLYMAVTFPDELSKDHYEVKKAQTVVDKVRAFLA